jgi:hypothetical protein
MARCVKVGESVEMSDGRLMGIPEIMCRGGTVQCFMVNLDMQAQILLRSVQKHMINSFAKNDCHTRFLFFPFFSQ